MTANNEIIGFIALMQRLTNLQFSSKRDRTDAFGKQQN